MKRYKTFAVLLVALFCFYYVKTGYAHLEINKEGEVVETAENGSINWTTKRIEAKGSAEKDQSLFKQKVSAEVLARANLLKILDAVQIESERIVRDGRLKGEISTEKVQGLLKHSFVTEPVTNNLGLVEVTAFVYLDEKGHSALLPYAEPAFTSAAEPPVQSSFEKLSKFEQGNYTGLIIDASGYLVRPAMMPKIFAENAKHEFFRPLASDRKDYINEGFCGYTSSIEKAKQLVDRIGGAPLVVRATGVSANGVDFYVSSADASKIKAAEQRNAILRMGRVMIVVNKFSASQIK